MPVRTYVLRNSTWKARGSWADLTGGAGAGGAANRMLLGSSIGGASYDVHRVYDQGSIPSSYASSGASGDFSSNASTVWSCPPDMASFTSGAQDQAFKSFLASIPSGALANGRPYMFYCNMWHEPDVKVNLGRYTAAQFYAASSHMADLIMTYRATSGRTDIIPTVNTTLMPFSGGHGYAPLDFYNPNKHQMFLLDSYNKAAIERQVDAYGNPVSPPVNIGYDGNSFSTMASRFAAATNWFAANNVTGWGIGETNAYEFPPGLAANQYPAGGYDKIVWLNTGLQHLYDLGCKVFCYWNQNFQSDWDYNARTIQSSAAFTSAWNSAITKYRTP